MNNFDKKNKMFAESLIGKVNNENNNNKTKAISFTKDGEAANEEDYKVLTDNKTEKQMMPMLIQSFNAKAKMAEGIVSV